MIFVAMVIFFAVSTFAVNDSIHIKFVKGIEDGFILNSFVRVVDSCMIRVITVSTTPTQSGFVPVKLIPENIDTVGRSVSDTITSGLPTAPANLYVWEWLINGTDTTFSNIGTVTTIAKPTKPSGNYVGTPYNNKGKIFSNLSLNTNVNAKLYAFTVFNAVDTLGKKIPRKSWVIDPKTKIFVDSSYTAGSTDVFVCYSFANPADSIKFIWKFVPAYIASQKPDAGLTKISELDNTSIRGEGWVQTYNLETKIRAYSNLGDSSIVVTIPAGNGIDYWSADITGLTPGKNYVFTAIAINSKGSRLSNSMSHKMGSTPAVWNYLTNVKADVNGGWVAISCNYYLPNNKTGNLTFDYCEDSLFTFPIDWKDIAVQGTGIKSWNFAPATTGKYYARVTLTDYDTINVSKIVPFEILTLGISEKTENKISVYPNPASNFVTIETIQYEKVTIWNLFGKNVLSGFTNTQIDVRSLSNGTYTCKVRNSGMQLIIAKK